MLTKSLHTITAATNVARYLLRQDTVKHYLSSDAPAAELAIAALTVLGHGAPLTADDTFSRIVKNCAALLAERTK